MSDFFIFRSTMRIVLVVHLVRLGFRTGLCINKQSNDPFVTIYIVVVVRYAILKMKKNLLLIIIASFLSGSLYGYGEDTVRTDTKQKARITGIPTLSYNRSRGMGFGGTGMLFFPLGNDPATPPSRISLHGQISTNKSWYVSAFAQLFLLENRLRLVPGGGYIDSRFQTYVDMGDMGLVEIPFDNRGPFMFFAPMFMLYKGFYVGPVVQLMRLDVTFDLPDGSESKETDYANSLGIATMFDTKDNQYTPSKGIMAAARLTDNPKWMGNDSIFGKLMLFANYYHPINRKMILASRVTANIGIGDVPFASQSYVGNKDLRGYTKGEYRGNQTYTAQTEFRWNFYKRLGAVGFFGLAITVDPVSQLLPAGGIGIRYKILPQYNINAGVDGAVGKDDWGIYFRITEAF